MTIEKEALVDDVGGRGAGVSTFIGVGFEGLVLGQGALFISVQYDGLPYSTYKTSPKSTKS